MNSFKNAILAVAALGASLTLASTLRAQDTPSPGAQSPGMGTMGSGNMGEMSGMGHMAGMMKMMEDCNRMMQSMNNQNPQDPSRQTPPATPDRKG